MTPQPEPKGSRSAGFGRLGPWSARVALLTMYGADEEVGLGLATLHDAHYRTPWPRELGAVRRSARRSPEGEYVYPTGEAAGALLAALGDLVDGCGLARLGRDEAMGWVHLWALLRAELGESVGADALVSSLGLSYMVPEPDTDVPWRPDRETKAQAADRARERGTPRRVVRESLRATQSGWAAAGWDFPDAHPEAGRELRWLFLRLRHGWTYAEIAEREGLKGPEAYAFADPGKSVQAAVVRMARLAEADASRGR